MPARSSARVEPRRATAARRRSPRGAGRRGRRRPGRRARSGRRRSRRSGSRAPSSRSVLCSAISSDVPPAASCRSASPTRRVPAGSSWAVGSSRITWRGRIASRAAIATSWAWPPDSRAGSRELDRLDAEQRQRLARPLDDLGHLETQVHRPERDLLEDGRRDPRALRVRVLEADDHAARRARASSARPSARRRSSASRSAPRRSTPARAPRRRGRASTCRPRSARRARRSRRRRA